jgi:hypothetical protein
MIHGYRLAGVLILSKGFINLPMVLSNNRVVGKSGHGKGVKMKNCARKTFISC